MKQIVTQAIILQRTNYGEADRILTVLTPDQGKLRLMARGVRKVKSKLAGGIELFSVSNITFIYGRGEIGTLISTRLHKHYGNITKDINRTMLGYELIRQVNRATEDESELDWFELLSKTLEALNDPDIDSEIINFWFPAQMLNISGYSPELQIDSHGQPLDSSLKYKFDFTKMSFTPNSAGAFGAEHIKYLRLAFSRYKPETLKRVGGAKELAEDCSILLSQLVRVSIRT